jgi:hypothetical protein
VTTRTVHGELRKTAPPRAAARPGRTTAIGSRDAAVLRLQRLAGNAAVTGALAPRLSVQRGAEKSEHNVTEDEARDMPAVGDAKALMDENRALYAKKAKNTATPQDLARMAELDRLLDIRLRGDEAETLRVNGVTSTLTEWFDDISDHSFLGKTARVHKSLAERLTRAEAELAKVPAPANGWLREEPSSLRKPGEGLHALGLAIDLNAGTDPYLLNPGANAKPESDANRAILDVILRAQLLVRGEVVSDADFEARPAGADRAAKVDASYEKLSESSGALKRYFELDADAQAAALAERVTAIGDKSTLTVDQWKAQIVADRATLNRVSGPKQWRKPTSGFLDLDKRLVQAMTSSAGAGLDWLGDDTIGGGRDIMHFDMRTLGPVHKVVRSAAGNPTGIGLGSG